MVSKSLLSLIYEATSIQRWNDHIRPWTGFTELDKQAHKMFYAYVLAKCEGNAVDWVKLTEGGIFEFFHRIVLTDIKPPIYHKLVEEKGVQIDNYVLTSLEEDMNLIGGGLFDRMKHYYAEPDYSELEKKILKAAHYYATDWEFQIIYPMNPSTFGIEQVKNEVTQGLAACDTFSGYGYFSGSPYLKEFLSLIGKLRYQKRWSKAVRVPDTFVMGHMLVVAILSYFMTLELDNPCGKRKVNNFFAGLFHDVPEALTRDIVSPVKRSVEGLEDIIRGIEEEQMEKVIYPLLPPSWHDELKYYMQDEFSSKIIKNGQIEKVDSDIINGLYNDDHFNPVDGQIIRGCDHLSALIETYLSISCGVSCEQTRSGYEQLSERYKEKVIAGIDFSKVFGYFKIN